MNLSFKIQVPKSLSGRALIAGLSVVLLIMFVLDGLALYNGLRKVQEAIVAVPTTKKVPVVRVDFKTYEMAVEKITDVSYYDNSVDINTQSPFRVIQ